MADIPENFVSYSRSQNVPVHKQILQQRGITAQVKREDELQDFWTPRVANFTDGSESDEGEAQRSAAGTPTKPKGREP